MDLIKEAGLNTLLGMGMTFLVLISLSLIIALFGKLLNRGPSKKEKAPAPLPQPKAPEKAKAQAAPAREGSVKAVSGSEPAQLASGEDPQLMAVIAAAIAAYESEEGAGSAPAPGVSGFAVRKIRKSRRHVA